MNEIGKMIQKRRKELGLTLEDVGKAVGVGRSTVQRWESGLIKNMGRDKIAQLAKVLQINPIEIVPMDGVLPWDETADILDQTIVLIPSAEDQQQLEDLHQNPRLKMLFDRTRKMSEADVDFMIQMADRILREQDGE